MTTRPRTTPGPTWIHVVGGLAVAVFASALVGAIAATVAGWDTMVEHGRGADVGRNARQVLTGEAFGTDEPGLVALALLQIPLWSGFLGAAFLARRQTGDDLGWRFRPGDVPLGLAVGVATQLVAVPLLYQPVFWIFGEHDVAEPARVLTSRATSGVGVALLALVVVVGAPVVEELFFRGVLYRAVDHRVGAVAAVVVSSLVFALVHLQLLQSPALFLFGVVAALLVWWSGRLGPAVFAHVGFNLTTVVALLAA